MTIGKNKKGLEEDRPRPVVDPEEVKKRVEQALNRVCPFEGKAREYLKELLTSMIMEGTIPARLLKSIPVRAAKVGKTRFDQLYDAAMHLAFPPYSEDTLQRFIGPSFHTSPDTKAWRAVFPERFGISHIVLRAATYQEAFSLACDYACRMSLRISGEIPDDLTIRVISMSERDMRKKLGVRMRNRKSKRRILKLIGQAHTQKEVMGARLCALGDPRDRRTGVARYVELQDLNKIQQKKGIIRISALDAEVKRVTFSSSERHASRKAAERERERTGETPDAHDTDPDERGDI